jgi:serine/threonine protein kinase
MKEVQALLMQLYAGSITIDELQKRFADLLREDSQLPAMAGAWLDACSKNSLLSEDLHASLGEILAAHVAQNNLPVDEETEATILESDVRSMAGESQVATRLNSLFDDSSARTAISQSAHLTIGSVVGERYELLEQLGAGGMGTVYKARDRLRAEAQDRNPYVALKVIGERFKEHPDSIIALQREVSKAQKLAHPNVITVHEFFRDGPHYYMTMELLEGEPLNDCLKGKLAGGTTMEKAWPIINGVGEGLKYGHQKGIVHSDVKPGNIFLCKDGTVKLLDLGISRSIPITDDPNTEHTLFDAGERLGGLSPPYASLEMWMRDTPDPSDDIYALACVSYQLLTGRHPFEGLSAKKAYEADLTPGRIESLARGQWAALSGGLQFLRADRTKSVDEFLRELAPQSAVRSRQRMITRVTAVVATVLLAVGVWYYGLFVEDRLLDDRGRIGQGAASQVERPELTDAQLAEMSDLVVLAELQISQLDRNSSTDDYIYVIRSGPNSVSEIVNTILKVDPGYEAGIELRQRGFNLLLERARAIRREQPAEALTLTRSADAMIANSSQVLRLQRTICDDAPEVCG